jgi:hypothetical protein
LPSQHELEATAQYRKSCQKRHKVVVTPLGPVPDDQPRSVAD